MEEKSGDNVPRVGMQTRQASQVVVKEDDKQRVNWTDDNIKKHFISVLLEFTKKGHSSSDNGFKSAVWKLIREKFNRLASVDYTRTQLQSQLSYLKKSYNIFKSLKENSGFGLNADDKLPTASEDVWARYIEVHPEAAKYKAKTLQYFDELDVIFGGSCNLVENDEIKKKKRQDSSSSLNSIAESMKTMATYLSSAKVSSNDI